VLCDALVGACQVPMIREHFADALGAAGWHSAVAEAIFFLPAAIAEVPHLIAVCGAVPSPTPDRECSILLVGEQSDWDLLPRGTH
jgi:hypothetical protein